MAAQDYYKPGDWNALCSMCGRKRKAGEMVKNWQGMYRCPEHNEQRHPQDFVKNVVDDPTPPWVQPVPEDIFAMFCSPNDQSAIPDFAVPGCFMPDYLSPFNSIFDPSCSIEGHQDLPDLAIPDCAIPVE